MGSTLLQIFLLVNVFVIGLITSVAIRHAYAHFKPHPEEPEKHPQKQHLPDGHLPAAVKQKILQEAETKFQAVLNHSAEELEHDLKATNARLGKQLEKLGIEIANSEMKRYRADLEKLRKQTDENISGAQSEIAEHQADLKAKLAAKQKELEAKLEQNMNDEKQLLISQLNTKLSDAVASFLIETMQHNVDLGSQSQYLITMLEEHKEDLIKEIRDEA